MVMMLIMMIITVNAMHDDDDDDSPPNRPSSAWVEKSPLGLSLASFDHLVSIHNLGIAGHQDGGDQDGGDLLSIHICLQHFLSITFTALALL